MPARLLILTIALLAAALSGCAGRQPPQPDYDPWEGLNRKTFWVNDKLDVYALEPIARGWDYVMPDPVQRSISRFFYNLLSVVLSTTSCKQSRAPPPGLARFRSTFFVGSVLRPGHASAVAAVEEHRADVRRVGLFAGPICPAFFAPQPARCGRVAATSLGSTRTSYPSFVTVGASALNIVKSARATSTRRQRQGASLDYYTCVRNGKCSAGMLNASLWEPPYERSTRIANDEIYEEYLEGDHP